MNISQGNAAIHLRHGANFNNNFTTNFLLNIWLKNCKNRSVCGEDMDQRLVTHFWLKVNVPKK